MVLSNPRDPSFLLLNSSICIQSMSKKQYITCYTEPTSFSFTSSIWYNCSFCDIILLRTTISYGIFRFFKSAAISYKSLIDGYVTCKPFIPLASINGILLRSIISLSTFFYKSHQCTKSTEWIYSSTWWTKESRLTKWRDFFQTITWSPSNSDSTTILLVVFSFTHKNTNETKMPINRPASAPKMSNAITVIIDPQKSIGLLFLSLGISLNFRMTPIKFTIITVVNTAFAMYFNMSNRKYTDSKQTRTE